MIISHLALLLLIKSPENSLYLQNEFVNPYTPYLNDSTGPVREKPEKVMDAAYEAQVTQATRTEFVNGALKTSGFLLALGAGIAALTVPLIPAIAVTTSAAIVGISNAMWPLGLGIMGFGKIKQMFTERILWNKMARSRGRGFRKDAVPMSMPAPKPA